MISEHPIQIERQLRYFLAGDPDSAHSVLLALHGYGQHPGFFLKKMLALVEEGWCVLAPEGLHRFYTQGMSGRVGASWMTKEDRMADINDNIKYLSHVCELPFVASKKHRVLLGFSQGTATALRFYCANSNVSFQQLIMWAGSFPHDLDLPVNLNRINEVGIDLTVGCRDEFIKSQDVQNLRTLLDEAGVKYRYHEYDGGHDIDIDALRLVLRAKVV